MKSFIFAAFCGFAVLTQVRPTTGQLCQAPVDVVVLLDASQELSKEEFYGLRFFVGQIFQFFNESQTRVSVVVYGFDAFTFTPLWPAFNEFQFRFFLGYLQQLPGPGHNLVSGLRRMREIFWDPALRRPGVPQVGVVFTAVPDATPQAVIDEAAAARRQGIRLYAVGRDTGREFPAITDDKCRLFSLGSFENLTPLGPFLAGSICSNISPTLPQPTPNNCFPFLSNIEPPPIICPSLYGNFANPKNCATFYACDLWVPKLMKCNNGLVFNPKIGVCDHQRNVVC